MLTHIGGRRTGRLRRRSIRCGAAPAPSEVSWRCAFPPGRPVDRRVVGELIAPEPEGVGEPPHGIDPLPFGEVAENGRAFLDERNWVFAGGLRFLVGVPSALLGGLLPIWGIATIGWKNSWGVRDGFIPSGPCRFTRNPPYLGNTLILLGLRIGPGGLRGAPPCGLRRSRRNGERAEATWFRPLLVSSAHHAATPHPRGGRKRKKTENRNPESSPSVKAGQVHDRNWS